MELISHNVLAAKLNTKNKLHTNQFMSATQSTAITDHFWGMDFETSVILSISEPNPSGAVRVSWALDGKCTSHPSVHPPGYSSPQSCGYVEGATAGASYSDSMSSGVAVGKKWNICLATGQRVPGTPEAGEYAIWACCRVEDIDDGPDYLRVKLHNYLEVRESYFIFGSCHWACTNYSTSQVVRPWVKKIA